MIKNKKYRVVVSNNTVIIYNNRTGFNRCFDVHEFVYGQGLYNDITDKYPNYIHAEIWKQWGQQKN